MSKGTLSASIPAVIFVILLGCSGRESSETAFQKTGDLSMDRLLLDIESGRYEDVTAFEGTLPCADCEGIETRLIFIHDNLTYLLTEKYLGIENGNSNTFSSYGPFRTQLGFVDGERAVIFVINPEHSEVRRGYRLFNDTTLQMLDRNMEEIETDLNYNLIRTFSISPEG